MPETPEKRSRSTNFLEDDADDTAAWITTYADLITLLLVFFVLLFAISSLDMQKFRMIALELKKSFGNPTAVIKLVVPDIDRDKARQELTPEPEEASSPTEPKEIIIRDIPVEILEELDDTLLDDVQKLVEKERVGENIVVYQERNRITIMIEGQVLFNSGEANLRPEAQPLLDDIVKIIQDHPNYRVNIKGHTDNQPISTVQFPSNWELSAVRATTVLRYLVALGVDPMRLTATGYGELLPLAANDTPENRARNRRVEFVLEKERKRD